jgi:hypothetical protein
MKSDFLTLEEPNPIRKWTLQKKKLALSYDRLKYGIKRKVCLEGLQMSVYPENNQFIYNFILFDFIITILIL